MQNTNHAIALFFRENWRSFVLRYFGVVVNANNELIAHRFCLSKLICVTKMNHIIAEITLLSASY